MTPTLTFYGGARAVTGANYLLDTGRFKILVDCGLHQGSKYADDLNYQEFEYDPKTVDVVLVTHSHIDHVGRLPKLFKDGFRGTVYATEATKDLVAVALPDNLRHIQEEAEREGHEPLYTEQDIQGILNLTQGVAYHEPILLDGDEGIRITFYDAGHILGSSIVKIDWGEGAVVFSGDLGNPPTPLLKPTEFVGNANYLVMESAYGDRLHEARGERREKLVRVIAETVERKGVLMIPSFALERTQELLFELNHLVNTKAIPEVPIFIDSPLAIRMTEVYRKHADYLNRAAGDLISLGDDIFNFPGLKLAESIDQSKGINDVPKPKIIIAGSGMSHGGRILHHERRYLSDPNSTILFIGYQVDGSLGRRIQRGDSEVTIFGETIPVLCRKETIASYSAHADQNGLVEWVRQAKLHSGEKEIRKVFLVQGEEKSAQSLAERIRKELDIQTVVPQEKEEFKL